MSRPRALVLLNPASGQGRGEERWAKARSEVEDRFLPAVVRMDSGAVWRTAVRCALGEGVRMFLAAGGDGTVHALAGELVASRGEHPLPELTLGAVGLGSSNDFHKPFRTGRCGLPLRIDARRAEPRDLAVVCTTDASGHEARSVLVVSGSVGIAAEANALFGTCSLARSFTGGAIALSALRAVIHHRPLHARVLLDGVLEELELSSLSVLKTPCLGGSFRFDAPVGSADGRLAVAICEGMSRARLVTTLGRLLLGRFRGKGTRALAVSSLEISAAVPFALELDGEVRAVRAARFAVLPERIRACA